MDQTGEILPPATPSEMEPSLPATPESLPLEERPESLPSKGPEQAGAAINRSPQPSQAAPLTLPPVVVPTQALPTEPPATAAATPTSADDVEIIEKEWVDKARKIVAQTRDDPHRQEQAVEELQRAYLKTRYNKDLKPRTG